MISHLVAAATNNAIGKDGGLIWHLPNDMKYFKNLTWGMVVVMGRKTYESMNRPLPGRLNIVVTTNPEWKAEGVRVCHTPEEAIELARAESFKEIFIIGGGEIYKHTLPLTDRIYMTRVHAEPEGDAHYPEIDSKAFSLSSSTDFSKDEKHAWDYTFEVWDRITA